MSQAVSPLLLERYELKYLIPIDLVEPISKFAEMYCDMDHYSQISPDHYYTINSLYFDSDDFKIFNFKQTAPVDRVSLRIRSYGDDPKPPYFFEVKRKHNQIVKKLRGKVFAEDLEDFYLNFGADPKGLESKSCEAVRQFLYWTYNFQATPKVLTQYRRKAYISNVDDYARVTFDRDLRQHLEPKWNVKPRERDLVHYDNCSIFEDAASLVILELKSTTRIPYWIIDLIRFFDLKRESISKFENAMITEFSKQEQLSGSRVAHF